MNTFQHKGYGRIYVDSFEDINKVKAVIKEMDDYEYTYMPENLITTFSEYPKVIYTHKFSDLSLDAITALCWTIGVKVWCFNSGRDEAPEMFKPISYSA